MENWRKYAQIYGKKTLLNLIYINANHTPKMLAHRNALSQHSCVKINLLQNEIFCIQPSLKTTKLERTPYFFSCYCNIFLLFIIVSEEECYNVVFEVAFTWQQRTKDAYKHSQKNNFIHNLIFRAKIKATKFTTETFFTQVGGYF